MASPPRSRTSAGVGQLVGKDGDTIGGLGPPTFAGNWVENDDLNPYQLAEGRAPRRGNEVVIDRGSAEDGDFARRGHAPPC